VRLVTSLGMVNLELRSDLVPKTVHNFLLLCQKGYYNGTKFHRLIKGFMMQVQLRHAVACAFCEKIAT
jgi:cyclophilin family peptidyl-prolyl cis-trans isomerase